MQFTLEAGLAVAVAFHLLALEADALQVAFCLPTLEARALEHALSTLALWARTCPIARLGFALLAWAQAVAI